MGQAGRNRLLPFAKRAYNQIHWVIMNKAKHGVLPESGLLALANYVSNSSERIVQGRVLVESGTIRETFGGGVRVLDAGPSSEATFFVASQRRPGLGGSAKRARGRGVVLWSFRCRPS